MADGDIEASILVAGHVREGDPNSSADGDFVPNAIAEMFKHWIRLAHPDITADRVAQALVVFGADNSTSVLINEQVVFLAVAGRDATICDPASVFIGQILSIWPDGVDPDLAWTGFTTADGGRIVVCDYRRNRARIETLLELAAKYLQTAILAAQQGLHEPAVENAHTAAELAVMTLILVDGWNDRRNHHRRREWLAREVASGSVPATFGEAFDALGEDRNRARYAERPLLLADTDLTDILADVHALLEYATARRAG